MPLDALPGHLQDDAAWKGTDWDTWYQRWMIPFKSWTAFGPRAKAWWAAWREVPTDLFKINDGTPWRKETIWYDKMLGFDYTSRVQYFSRWHFMIQWPLSISFHIYWRKEDVPTLPPTNFSIKQLFFAYGPVHFDQDQVYWMPSFYIGGQWK